MVPHPVVLCCFVDDHTAPGAAHAGRAYYFPPSGREGSEKSDRAAWEAGRQPTVETGRDNAVMLFRVLRSDARNKEHHRIVPSSGRLESTPTARSSSSPSPAAVGDGTIVLDWNGRSGGAVIFCDGSHHFDDSRRGRRSRLHPPLSRQSVPSANPPAPSSSSLCLDHHGCRDAWVPTHLGTHCDPNYYRIDVKRKKKKQITHTQTTPINIIVQWKVRTRFDRV